MGKRKRSELDPVRVAKALGAEHIGPMTQTQAAERLRMQNAAPLVKTEVTQPPDGSSFTFEAPWDERLERLADAAGVQPRQFLLGLLRKAWVSLPRNMRRDDDPPHGGGQ